MRSYWIEWPLIQYDWCLYFFRKGRGWSLDTATHTGRTSCEDEGRDQCDAVSVSQGTPQMASRSPEAVLQGRANFSFIWIPFLTFASCFFCSLKGHCPYKVACLRKPCLSAWILNQNAFVQDRVHLWMATGKKKWTHSLPEASHSRRYL